MIRTVDFQQFRAAIAALPLKSPYLKADLLSSTFRLFTDRGVDVFYCPFHRMNRSASIILVGVTPGWTQMELAYRTARSALAEGLPDEGIFERVELTGSFGGPMRKNLVTMLDGIGMNTCLRIPSCAVLFSDDGSHLAHFTSVVSAPIFKNGENYTGHNPAPLSVPKICSFIRGNLVHELNEACGAVIVPLGKVAAEVVAVLQAERAIDPNRVVLGLPHPSGANGHRRAVYEAHRGYWRDLLSRRQLA
jgi:hypothetical protein